MVEPVGNEAFLDLGCGGCELILRVPPRNLPQAGRYGATWGTLAEQMHIFDQDTGESALERACSAPLYAAGARRRAPARYTRP